MLFPLAFFRCRPGYVYSYRAHAMRFFNFNNLEKTHMALRGFVLSSLHQTWMNINGFVLLQSNIIPTVLETSCVSSPSALPAPSTVEQRIMD